MFRSRLPSDPPVVRHGAQRLGRMEALNLRASHCGSRCLRNVCSGTTDGKAFIRMGGVSFRRSDAASKLHGADEGFTGLVEAVVFEKSQESMIGYMTDVR